MNELFIIEEVFPVLIAAGAVVIPTLASYHVITTKDDVRAAIGWAGLVWLVPFVGTVFYLLFGINRIRRKAARVRGERKLLRSQGKPTTSVAVEQLSEAARAHNATMDRITVFELCEGNRVRPFITGDAAFEAMLEAIDDARHSIALATYIFDYDAVGQRFVAALKAAVRRGVEVRVLIDGVGELYHFPSSWRMLRRAGVTVERFNRSWVPWRMAYLNLRNHRKIMTVDGCAGFTGGMNLREGHLREAPADGAIRDLHFCLEGPIVAQLTEVFAEDWAFASGETLSGDAWFPNVALGGEGGVLARGIPDGPDEDLHKITWAILSGLGMARRKVRIMTPYFLPDRIIVAALNHAALRGVEVDILLPEKSNLKVVQWASRAQYAHILQSGCRIHHVPAPFDHAKLLIVDDEWVLLGSSNWDARSLRLNFEFNVECHDRSLAARLIKLFEARLASSSPVGMSDMAKIPAILRLRNGLAWLLSPYL